MQARALALSLHRHASLDEYQVRPAPITLAMIPKKEKQPSRYVDYINPVQYRQFLEVRFEKVSTHAAAQARGAPQHHSCDAGGSLGVVR